jgi:hypothetical protein
MSVIGEWIQQRKSDIYLAAFFSIIAVIFFEGLKKITETSSEFINEHSWIKGVLEWIILLLPWLLWIFLFYLYLKWKGKAKIANNEKNTFQTQTQTLTTELAAKNQELSQAESKLELMSKWEGIEPITGLDKYIRKLEGSGHHPKELLEKIDRKMDFMGHGASKWTANKAKLSKMLDNIHYNDKEGKVRFLVINPTIPRLEIKPERAQTIAGSLRTLWELQRKHKNLEVKIYDHIPQLRLTFYDDEIVVVGHYQGKERQDSSNTPLFIFFRKCDWSFYKAFLSHFEEEWKRATVLDDKIMTEIEKLI